MCEKNKSTRMDRCMKNLIEVLNRVPGIETQGSCCGHGKYPMTIIVRHEGGHGVGLFDVVYELMTGISIPRKRSFYKKDKQGFYYIPEVVEGEAK